MTKLKPQYEIETIKSTVKTSSLKMDLAGKTNNSEIIYDYVTSLPEDNFRIIVWQVQGLYIGNVESGIISIDNDQKSQCKFEKDDKFWLRARVFSENEEYHIWKAGDEFKVRHRKDGQGDKVNMITSKAVLRGTIVAGKDNDKKERMVVRNYIGYNDVGVAQVEDMRFVKILKG